MATADAIECTLELRGELTIRTAADTHQQLQNALQEGSGLTLDMTYADDIDLTLVQLLFAAAKSASQKGKHFKLVEPLPEHISALLARGGFSLAQMKAVS